MRTMDSANEKINNVSPEVDMEAQTKTPLNLSHENLTANTRNFSKDGPIALKKTVSPVMDRPKKVKEKALNDITNKLEVRPVTLKQTRAESNLPKGIKRINQVWVNEDIIEIVMSRAKSAHSNRPRDTRVSGETSTRPPNPRGPVQINGAAPSPNHNLGNLRDGGAMDQSRATPKSSSGGDEVRL